MTQQYRKKPIVIEAMRIDSYDHDGMCEIVTWCGGRAVGDDNHVIAIDTLEGTMYADPGDYVIKGVQGEFYPCKPDIFEATYESAEIVPGTVAFDQILGYSEWLDTEKLARRPRRNDTRSHEDLVSEFLTARA